MTRKRLKRLIMSLGIQRNDAEDMLHECRISGKTHADYWTHNWKLIHIRATWMLIHGEKLGLPPTLRTADARGGITGFADFSRLTNALNTTAQAFIGGMGTKAIHAAQVLRRFSETAKEAQEETRAYGGTILVQDGDIEEADI